MNEDFDLLNKKCLYKKMFKKIRKLTLKLYVKIFLYLDYDGTFRNAIVKDHEWYLVKINKN